MRSLYQYAAMAIVLAGWAGAVGAETETLRYIVTPDPDTGRINVDVTWQTYDRGASRLCLASQWGTVQDVSGLVRDLQFEGAESWGPAEACWDIHHARNAELHVTYTIDTGKREFDWSSTHHPICTRSFFHGFGATFLLTPASGGNMPEEYDVVLRWKLPDNWDAACSWGWGPSLGQRMRSSDVRQSVYLAGRRLVKSTANVPNAGKVTVVLIDRFGFSSNDLAQLAVKIIGAEVEFMREEHFPDFVVTAIPIGEPLSTQAEVPLVGMGLFHSFALCLAPESKITDTVEHLFAHELFHYWNGRVLSAADPERGVYWFVEGFTDYYALRILHASGLWSDAMYAKWINLHLREYHENPAKNATNQEIVADFWRARDTVGAVAYQRGLLLGLRWHYLAQQNGVAGGLDTLFRALVERGRTGFLVSNAAIRKEGVAVLGAWFGAEFDRHVEEAETVEVPADALAPELEGRERLAYTFELGFDRAESLKALRVTGLVANSAAEKAGLQEGDTLIGWQLHRDPQRRIVLQVKRGNRVEVIQYFPRGARYDVLQFRPARTK